MKKQFFPKEMHEAVEKASMRTKLASWGIIGAIAGVAFWGGRRSGIKSVKV